MKLPDVTKNSESTTFPLWEKKVFLLLYIQLILDLNWLENKRCKSANFVLLKSSPTAFPL